LAFLGLFRCPTPLSRPMRDGAAAPASRHQGRSAAQNLPATSESWRVLARRVDGLRENSARTLQRSISHEMAQKREFDSEAGPATSGRGSRNLLFRCHLCKKGWRDAKDAWTARFSVLSPVFVFSSLSVFCCVVSP
jgi:hypothetical protein